MKNTFCAVNFKALSFSVVEIWVFAYMVYFMEIWRDIKHGILYQLMPNIWRFAPKGKNVKYSFPSCKFRSPWITSLRTLPPFQGRFRVECTNRIKPLRLRPIIELFCCYNIIVHTVMSILTIIQQSVSVIIYHFVITRVFVKSIQYQQAHC